MPDHDKYKEGSSGPRRFGEHKLHKNLKKLHGPDLRAGDILIAKEWSPHNKESLFIPAAQAIFSHHKGASAVSEHVLLVVEDGKAATAQSASKGVFVSTGVYMRDHVVYGCTSEDLRWASVFVAKRLAGVANAPGGEDQEAPAAPATAPVQFRSKTGAARVLFRKKALGKGGTARLRQIYDYVYDDRPLGDVRMVCSEFITACFEVAAMRLTEETGNTVKAFGVDPRAISAKALEALVRDGAAPFQLSGRYRGTISYTDKQKAEEARQKAAAREGLKTFGEGEVPEVIRLAREARARAQQQGQLQT